jgi:PEGA domain-containing protein
MPLPHDSIATKSAESAEDPLRFFLSEDQNAAAIPPVPPAPVASLGRFQAIIVAVLRSVVPRIALAISQAHPVISQVARRTLVSAVTIGAFACGIVIGGLAVWLSGASRHIAVESTASPHAPHEVARVAASPIAALARASTNPSVAQIADSQTEPPTAEDRDRIGSRQFRGSLIVNSRPSGAFVFVNGRGVGQTPLVLRNERAGSRAVRVALDGYEPWSTAVRIVTDTEARLTAELKAQRSAERP